MVETTLRAPKVIAAIWLLGIPIAIFLLAYPSLAQDGANRKQTPPTEQRPTFGAELDGLRREQFRRRAAEAAQKQLEHLAEKMRQQLGEEVAARKAAEASLARLLERVTLTDQIDEERQRLRDKKLEAVEARNQELERQVLDLSRQLAEEKANKEKLQTKIRTTANASADRGSNSDEMRSRIKQLERELNAAIWARKLAEAQLKLVSEREKRPSVR
ncbi:MAG: hypothetical protein KKB37_04385 [Alphaproteobacteria bacterium]|nr:hypothetical protein [Alphaproteobacteria bacterium]